MFVLGEESAKMAKYLFSMPPYERQAELMQIESNPEPENIF